MDRSQDTRQNFGQLVQVMKLYHSMKEDGWHHEDKSLCVAALYKYLVVIATAAKSSINRQELSSINLCYSWISTNWEPSRGRQEHCNKNKLTHVSIPSCSNALKVSGWNEVSNSNRWLVFRRRELTLRNNFFIFSRFVWYSDDWRFGLVHFKPQSPKDPVIQFF